MIRQTKAYFAFSLLLLALLGSASQVNAQCTPRTGSFYGEILPSNTCGTFNTITNIGPGWQYFRTPVLRGASYTFSTCGTGFDTQLTGYQANNSTTTIFVNNNNGPACTGTAASATYVPTFTDYVRAQIHRFNCTTSLTSARMGVRQNNNLTFTSAGTPMCEGQTRALTATPAAVGSAPANSGNLGTFSGTGVLGTNFTAPTPSGDSASYTITYSFGYCSQTQSITVYRLPSSAVAGPDQNVCTATTTLAATQPLIGTGTWTTLIGSGAVSNPNNASSGVTNLASGGNHFVWTVSNGPCTVNVDTVIITRDPLPTTSNAGPDQNVCAATATLGGNTATIGNGQWTLVTGSGTVTTPSSPNSGVTSLGVGQNVFRWTITNGTCSPSTDDVIITRDPDPTPSNAGPDQTVCDTSTVLAGNSPSVGSGTWTVVSGSGNIVTPNAANSQVSGLGVGPNVFRWTVSSGSCIASTDDVTITRNIPPTSPAVAGDTAVCSGSTALLTASSGVTSASFEWWTQASGGSNLGTGANFTTTPLTTTTTFYVEVTDNNSTCTSSRTAFTVQVNPNPTVNLGPDQSPCPGDTITLDAGANFTSYNWSNGITTRNLAVTASGIYNVTVTDSNGCTGTDAINVVYSPGININLGPDTTICMGTNIALDAGSNPNCSYLWSTGDTTSTIVVNAAGAYSVTCIDTNNCTATDQIIVSIGAAPAAGAMVDTSMCPMISFTDNSSGTPSNYLWDFGDGNTSTNQNPTNDYSAAGNGTYNVRLVVGNTCGIDTFNTTVVIDCLVATQDATLSEAVTVFPNPNNGIFRLNFEGLKAESLTFDVFGMDGKQIQARRLDNARSASFMEFDLSDQAAGVYFLRISDGNESFTKRVVIR